MKFHFSQGKQEFKDGHSVKFKELEIAINSRNTRLTIRIYPSNTFLTYHNNYKNITKVLHKSPHVDAQRNMGTWLDEEFRKMRIRVGGEKFDSIMQMYQKLQQELIE